MGGCFFIQAKAERGKKKKNDGGGAEGRRQ